MKRVIFLIVFITSSILAYSQAITIGERALVLTYSSTNVETINLNSINYLHAVNNKFVLKTNFIPQNGQSTESDTKTILYANITTVNGGTKPAFDTLTTLLINSLIGDTTPVSITNDSTEVYWDDGQVVTQLQDVARVTGSFKLPSITPAAYTIADVVGTNPATGLTMTNCATANGGSGWLSSVIVLFDTAAITNVSVRLHIYNDTITWIANHAQNTWLYANASKYVGYVDVTSFVAPGTEVQGTTGAIGQVTPANFPFRCATDDRNLYVVVEALGGFTQSKGGYVTVIFKTDQYY